MNRREKLIESGCWLLAITVTMGVGLTTLNYGLLAVGLIVVACGAKRLEQYTEGELDD